MHYEVDEHVQPFYSDDSVNVNCVLSWKVVDVAGGNELLIDLQNCWHSKIHAACRERYERAVAELRRISDIPKGEPHGMGGFYFQSLPPLPGQPGRSRSCRSPRTNSGERSIRS